MAFVLVSHLDPSHASMLTEILQRTTTMPVVEALDQIPVKPNAVYVIPPNRDLAIFHGNLQLAMPEEPRGQRMPIDAFLRSLAEDQQNLAIGIILSGTGSDGTLGLRATAVSLWSRNRPPPNMTACHPVQLSRVLSPTLCPLTKCRSCYWPMPAR